MAIRRLNFTGRRRIRLDDVRVTVHEGAGAAPRFDADLSALAGYGLPADAAVFVEARRQTRWMRFPFGTVGAPAPPADRALAEFDTADGVRFTVKVTAVADAPGRLLAEADGIAVRAGGAPGARAPLLPVMAADLGQEVYRVDFNTDPPMLLVNALAGDKTALATSPLFTAVVFPAALREILTHVLRVEEYDPDDEGGAWPSRWLRFAAGLPGVGRPPVDKDEHDVWIGEAVAAFARQQKMLDRFVAGWQKGGA